MSDLTKINTSHLSRVACVYLRQSSAAQVERQKRQGFGWERWSRRWLYDTLGLFNGYRVRRDGPKVAPAG